METSEKTIARQNPKIFLSTLWIFVLLNMIFADIWVL